MKNLPALTRHALTLALLTALFACSDGPETRTIPRTDNRPDVGTPEDAGSDADAGDAGDVDPDANDPDACQAESDEALCAENDAECGELTLADSCGTERTIDCGDENTVCAPLETCGGGGEDNLCGCTPDLSDEALCAENGAECGELTITDSCGEERTIDCGDENTVCAPLETCGGGGEDNLCGCTANIDEEALCAENGAECGELTITDSCGEEHTIDCGDETLVCDALETCGGGGEDNLCGCTPTESDTQLCQLNSYSCGPLTAFDSCGVERLIPSCGPDCSEPQTCGGGGIEGQCGCTPLLSDEQHCAENAAECGELTIVDSCGTERTIDCGAEDQVCTLFDTCGGGGEDNLCGCTPITCDEAQVMCGPIDDGCGGIAECDAFCVDAIAAGADHACAVGSGKLKCWGRNNSGQVGNGATGDQRNPVDISGLPTLVDVAPGGQHTCALSLNGEVYCWGENGRGQLGLGTTVSSRTPGDPAIFSGATAIASGFAHSCAVVNGGVRCWGANDYGQIGNSSIAVGSNINVGVAMQVDGLGSDVVDVVAGSHHSCALLDDGNVRCWGRNRFGQVGTLRAWSVPIIDAFGYFGNDPLDNVTLEPVPRPVAGLSDIAELAAGNDFTCARSSDGEVFCWGAMHRASSSGNTCFVHDGYFNAQGAMTGRNADRCAIFPPNGPAVARFSTRTGTDGSCADNPCADSSFTCNPDNNRCERLEFPIAAAFLNRAAFLPRQINTGDPALTISAGADHLCMVVERQDTQQTNIRCFGVNSVGQIGDGTNSSWNAPIDLYFDVAGNIVRGTDVTAGNAYSCALVDEQNVKCWGSNQYGQIGNSALQRDESYRPFDVKLEYVP